ncbi:MAG: transcriptional repressor [Deltaproteobacteria bacterium]|nr:transcriptional repressor [Deltaproteobacteria bacterium]
MADKGHKTELEIFLGFLNKRGKSLTNQRKLVIEQIFRVHKHLEADDIVQALRKKNQRVARATVYRTIKLLEDCGLIKKVDLGSDYTYYEHTHGHLHHEHICCEQCGMVEEFTDPVLEERIRRVAKDNNFKLTDHSVQIFGICQNCM